MVHSPILRHCVENQAAHSVTSPKKLKTKTAMHYLDTKEKKITIKSTAEKFRRPPSLGTQLRTKTLRILIFVLH